MLPDYPESKRKLRERLFVYLRERVKQGLGVLADVPPHCLFEGSAMVVEGSRKGNRPRPFKRLSGKAVFSSEEIATLTLPGAIARIEDMARQISEGQSEHSFRVIAEDLEEAGQGVDARGRALTPEVFFEVLEKIQMDFDEQGRAKLPTLVVGPALAQRASETFSKIQSDPECQQRMEGILRRKKADFDVREAARDLVG